MNTDTLLLIACSLGVIYAVIFFLHADLWIESNKSIMLLKTVGWDQWSEPALFSLGQPLLKGLTLINELLMCLPHRTPAISGKIWPFYIPFSLFTACLTSSSFSLSLYVLFSLPFLSLPVWLLSGFFTNMLSGCFVSPFVPFHHVVVAVN